jgi:FkbM family methyltransferase
MDASLAPPPRLAAIIRALPVEMRGKARLARMLLGQSLHRSGIVNDRYGNKLRVASYAEPVGFNLLINGLYGSADMRFMLSQLRPGALFVDVGANIGAYTLPAARAVLPGGLVLAIEPSPSMLPILEDNITRNQLQNVMVLPVAAGETEGSFPFFEAPADRPGMSSLTNLFGHDPVNVQIRRLDRMVLEAGHGVPDLIKVDVEGHEESVFRGAEAVLRGASPPTLLFEFLDWGERQARLGGVGATQRLLREWGFELWRLNDFLRGAPPIKEVLQQGSDMLVGIRGDRLPR